MVKSALEVATAAALKSGKFLLENLRKKKLVSFKDKYMKNVVTDIDKASEESIVRAIKRAFPSHDIIAEERGLSDSGSEFRWHIDPLDGTVNYVHGFPVFCVSIGLAINDEVVVGVVYNPNLNELFYATTGVGAFRNGERITVSKTPTLQQSLLATGFPYDLKTSKENNIAYFNAFIKEARAIRRAGSAAIDLCYVAYGIFDGFWEIKLGSWDMAAGCLIASEAGAKVTNIKGEKLDLYKGNAVASNGKIHKEMLKVIRDAKP